MAYLAQFWQLLLVVLLLVLGYGFGRLAERRHYRSILEREDELNDLIVVACKTLPDSLGTPRTQLVMGSVVVSVDYFKRFVAHLRMIFGGRVHTYESLIDRGRREAILRMQERAREQGASMIFNMRFETSSISKGSRQSVGSVEVPLHNIPRFRSGNRDRRILVGDAEDLNAQIRPNRLKVVFQLGQDRTGVGGCCCHDEVIFR